MLLSLKEGLKTYNLSHHALQKELGRCLVSVGEFLIHLQRVSCCCWKGSEVDYWKEGQMAKAHLILERGGQIA